MLRNAAKLVTGLSLLFALVFAFAPSQLSFANPLGQARASAPSCLHVSASFSAGVVSPGQRLSASGAVQNCSAHMENVTLVLDTYGSCSARHTVSQNLILLPGQAPSGSQTFPAPRCRGTYTAHVSAYSGS